MPNAWKQLVEEENQQWGSALCSSKTTELLGRDAEYVASAAISRTPDEKDRSIADARLLEMLKTARNEGSEAETGLRRPISSDQLSSFNNGDRVLLFFDSHQGIPMNVYECGVVPLNEVNLDLARKGIARDWRATIAKH